MKISIVTRSQDGWHTDQILRAAKDQGVKAELVNVSAVGDLADQAEKLGNVVIWRASSLDHESERVSFAPYLDNKILINESLFKYPLAMHKYVQQNMIAGSALTKKYAIKTYRAKTLTQIEKYLSDGLLGFPFIAKPNLGARGDDVELVHDAVELKAFVAKFTLRDFVFQNYITNDGDWRVIVLGGRPLGAIKRIAAKGSHLNNVSKGATAVAEDDTKILSAIYDLAVKAADVFRLRFTGVDIIRDSRTGEFKILEVNTAPQWNGEFGFQSITGIDVADELVRYSINMAARKSQDVPAAIEKYYKDFIGFDPGAEFHFASRMYLWTGDSWARDVLDRRRADYIGIDEVSIRATIGRIVERAESGPSVVNEAKKYRRKYFDKYPRLAMYNALFFKVVFCDSIYGLDIRPFIREVISDQELLATFNGLINDQDAIRVLSTHASNFFYLLRNYFKGRITLSSTILVDPTELLHVSRDYDGLIAAGELKPIDAIKQRIYLLTHAILGESLFYQRRVRSSGFRAIVLELQKIIYENYNHVSLDNKCEFLVCAKIVGHRSSLENIIVGEAEAAVSWTGNFIVDSANAHAGKSPHSLRIAEHRNVLLLMATAPFTPIRVPRKRKLTAEADRMVLGRLAQIAIPELGLRRAIARVDTGATSSSIHCSNLSEKDGQLSFKLFDVNHPLWSDKEFTWSDYTKTVVRNPTGGNQTRYAIKLTVVINGFEKEVIFSLADRTTMLYPILLGRNFIHKDFIVDIDRQFQERKTV